MKKILISLLVVLVSCVVVSQVPSGGTGFFNPGPSLISKPSIVSGTNWLGMTNKAVTVRQRATNQVVISGAGTAGVNGTYYWNAAKTTWTNGATYGIELTSGMPAANITNSSGVFLYELLAPNQFPTVWGLLSGSAPAPTGYIPTNANITLNGYVTTTNALYEFAYGIKSSSLNLGPANTNVYGATTVSPNRFLGDGPSITGSGYIMDLNETPSAFIAAASSTIGDSATFAAVIAGNNVLLNGSQLASLASSGIDAWCTNGDYAILGSEFGIVRNGNGIAAALACATFGDYSGGTAYALIGATSFTNGTVQESVILGGAQLVGMGSSYYTENKSVSINGSSSTNLLNNSVVIGPNMRMTNLDSSTVIGQGHTTYNNTNVFLFGKGLTTTSNNVMKLGFVGAELMINSNGITGNGYGLSNVTYSSLNFGGTPTVTTNVAWWTNVSSISGQGNSGTFGGDSLVSVSLAAGSSDYRGRIIFKNPNTTITASNNLFTLTFSTNFPSIPYVSASEMWMSNSTLSSVIAVHVRDITISNVLFATLLQTVPAGAIYWITYHVDP